jgi:hypothetical protein
MKKITSYNWHNKLSQLKMSTEKNDYLPWILGGVGVLGIVGIVTYFLTKKKGRKE